MPTTAIGDITKNVIAQIEMEAILANGDHVAHVVHAVLTK